MAHHNLYELVADSRVSVKGSAHLAPDREIDVRSIADSSNRVTPGGVFFCIRGATSDGHAYAADAVARGAVALVVEEEVPLDIPQLIVEDSRVALAYASAAFYDHPSHDLSVIGVTGTNGKTTITYLCEHILAVAGRSVGVIGTTGTRFGDTQMPSYSTTTPGSLEVEEILARMRDLGARDVAMEVSSHGIAMHRVDGIRFAVAAFTNLTQDHLDFHASLEEYFLTKASLFYDFDVDARVVCIDDDWGERLAQSIREAGHDVTTVSASGKDADFSATDIRFTAQSTHCTLAGAHAAYAMDLPLIGEFNVANALVALAITHQMGVSVEDALSALATSPQIPGRLELVTGDQGYPIFVDYSHTPDSLAKAIATVEAVTPGRTIVVFGCGGDRDTKKRPLMGREALAADIAVVTSDNPRHEDPRAIIDMIVPGMTGGEGRTVVKVDRREAIRYAVSIAQTGDAVLIAGKGHETYQLVGDEVLDFDDRVVAAEEVAALCSR